MSCRLPMAGSPATGDDGGHKPSPAIEFHQMSVCSVGLRNEPRLYLLQTVDQGRQQGRCHCLRPDKLATRLTSEAHWIIHDHGAFGASERAIRARSPRKYGPARLRDLKRLVVKSADKAPMAVRRYQTGRRGFRRRAGSISLFVTDSAMPVLLAARTPGPRTGRSSAGRVPTHTCPHANTTPGKIRKPPPKHTRHHVRLVTSQPAT